MVKSKRNDISLSANKSKAIRSLQVSTLSENLACKEQLAAALVNQGRLQDAEAIYKELIAAGSNDHITYGNLAGIYLTEGKHEESKPLLLSAIELCSDYADAHNNLGIVLKIQGDLVSAICSYNTALQLRPNYPDAHYNLGVALQETGDLAEAIASYKKALQLKPDFPEAHNNLGKALQEQGELVAAIASYSTALQLKPDFPEAHNNLGSARHEQGDLSAAINSYNTALQLKPDFPEANNNLGAALQEQGNIATAIAFFTRALQLKPDFSSANKNLSIAELLSGDYKSGLQRYECRFECKEEQGILHATPSCKTSKEETIVPGSKLLLISEQGLGDTLQFMRYVTALRSQGISVSFCAQSKLHSLIMTSGIDPTPFTPQQAKEVTEGNWIPLLSVPRLLGVSPENPIVSEPYIKTKNELIANWRSILSAEQRPIIGINWQGNPDYERTNSIGRSLSLESFAAITSNKDATLLSLQKGHGSEQMEACSFKDHFVSCQDQINQTWCFLETAAIIENCDLIITSDTSIAHLAGGMGKTTWLLLKKVPDWRWGLDGESTFWYPSMRLFRQKERGNWDEVMERVAKELQKHLGSIAMRTQSEPSSQPRRKPKMIQKILAPISIGELIDKITNLQIKANLREESARENIKEELDDLEAILNNLQPRINPTLIQRLEEVNRDLWQIKEAIRNHEHENDFGEIFIRLARSVHQQDDRREAIKEEINNTCSPAQVGETSCQQA